MHIWSFCSWFVAGGILYAYSNWYTVRSYGRTLVLVSLASFLGCAAVTGFYVYLLPAGRTRDAVAGVTFGFFLPSILYWGSVVLGYKCI